MGGFWGYLTLLDSILNAASPTSVVPAGELQLVHDRFMDSALEQLGSCICKADLAFGTVSQYQGQLDGIARLVALHKEPLKARLAEQVGLAQPPE